MLLPMPPMPSSTTRRQRSCTIHCVSSATSTSRPAKRAHVEGFHQVDAPGGGRLCDSGGSGCPDRWGKLDGRGRSEQVSQPVLVQQHLQVRRLPQRADLLLLAPGGKGLLLHRQADELLETLGFGVAQAPLPLRHGAPGDAQQLTQPCLAQADVAAQRLYESTKVIVSLIVRISLHERSPFCVTRRSDTARCGVKWSVK